jgi:hypothetical protein
MANNGALHDSLAEGHLMMLPDKKEDRRSVGEQHSVIRLLDVFEWYI